MLHSLDEPFALPFYAASRQVLTLAHLGDTRALLASSTSGRAVRLTDAHHPDSRVESDRLRRTGTGIITDSFGEMRWGGGLANTRGFGDRNYKAMGVTGEPEIIKRLINGAADLAAARMSLLISGDCRTRMVGAHPHVGRGERHDDRPRGDRPLPRAHRSHSSCTGYRRFR